MIEVYEPFTLRPSEAFWVKYQPYLHSRGYRLRPRYEPGWIPPWQKNKDFPWYHVDSHGPWFTNVIDARRIEDDIKVSLKRVRTATEEIPVARYLSSQALLSDPRNRTVPILDVIPLPDDDEWAFLVMPYLKRFYDPPFQLRVECLDFFRQVLQGLEFMHEHNVAHRDACYGNFMMDSRRLIPKGFHIFSEMTHDPPYNRDRFTRTTRTAVAPMQYFIIDFGLSKMFSSYEDRYLVTGKGGQDKTVPELSYEVPYDPFKVDIYQLGGVFKEIIEAYQGLDLFQPLVTAMMQREPAQRPDASSALAKFERIVETLGSLELNTPVFLHDDFSVTHRTDSLFTQIYKKIVARSTHPVLNDKHQQSSVSDTAVKNTKSGEV